ncbi:hypothetical protein ACFO6V_20030 [Promicromonospora alba]|uniref:PH (Pleckstrin Homology) domain-containing protein n=1 Tax=Promicromonospora alba TaxID=1616110 RepID=A0ABV9HNT3_9MICO
MGHSTTRKLKLQGKPVYQGEQAPLDGTGEVWHQVDVFTPGEIRTIAHLERELPPGGIPAYLAARRTGARSFVLWADEHRGARAATVVTVSCGNGVTVYQVLGPQGELLCTIERAKAFSKGLRTRWTVSRPGEPDLVGYKGRLIWWCTWWLFSPLLPFVWVVAVFNMSDVPRSPGRIVWRTRGRALLEFKVMWNEVYLHDPELDERAGAALLALVRSFDWQNGWDGWTEKQAQRVSKMSRRKRPS